MKTVMLVLVTLAISLTSSKVLAESLHPFDQFTGEYSVVEKGCYNSQDHYLPGKLQTSTEVAIERSSAGRLTTVMIDFRHELGRSGFGVFVGDGFTLGSEGFTDDGFTVVRIWNKFHNSSSAYFRLRNQEDGSIKLVVENRNFKIQLGAGRWTCVFILR